MTLFFVVLSEKKEFQKKKEGDFCTPKGSFKLKQSIIDPIELKIFGTKLNTKKIQ